MFKKRAHVLLFSFLLIAFACSPPELATSKNRISEQNQTRKNSNNKSNLIQGNGFTIQNIVQDELDDLSYEPDKYSQLKFLLNTGGPIKVTVERSIPKNFPIEFENVKVTPVNFTTRVNTLPEGENLELFKKFLLKSQTLWIESAQSEMWRELVKYLHDHEQKYETQYIQEISAYEIDSTEYLSIKEKHTVDKQNRKAFISKFKKALKKEFDREKQETLKAIEQKYSSSNFSLKGECIWPQDLGLWNSIARVRECNEGVEKINQDRNKLIQQLFIATGIHDLNGLNAEQLEQRRLISEGIEFSNEILKKSNFTNYKSHLQLAEDFYKEGGVAPQDENLVKTHEQPTQEFLLQDTSKPIPEQKTTKEVKKIDHEGLKSSISDTLSFLARYRPRDSVSRAFISPIFVSDIVEQIKKNYDINLHIPVKSENCKFDKTYFDEAQFPILYALQGQDYVSKCDIAVETMFLSLGDKIKELERRTGVSATDVEKSLLSVQDRAAAVGPQSFLRRLLGIDLELEGVVNTYQNKVLPVLADSIKSNSVDPNTGQIKFVARLGFDQPELIDNILTQINLSPYFGEGKEFIPTEGSNDNTAEWLLWLIRNYQEKGILGGDISYAEETALKDRLRYKQLAIEITTPTRCDYKEKTLIQSKIDSGEVKPLGRIAFKTSAENFAVDGFYKISLGLIDINQDDNSSFKSIVTLDGIPATELLGLSMSDLHERGQNALSIEGPQYASNNQEIRRDDVVSVGIINRSGNTFDISVEKYDKRRSAKDGKVVETTKRFGCDFVYQASCLPYNKSVFNLEYEKYRTGIYSMSVSYSKAKLTPKRRTKLLTDNGPEISSIFPWRSHGADALTGRIYGRNNAGYGSTYSFDFLITRPQYSTFVRETDIPRDFDFINTYSTDITERGVQPGYVDGFRVLHNNSLSDFFDEEAQKLHDIHLGDLKYIPSVSDEVLEEPKSKIAVFDSFGVDKFHRSTGGYNDGYKRLPNSLSNAIIDLSSGRENAQNTSYSLFSPREIEITDASRFLNVGAVVSLVNNHPDMRASLYKMSIAPLTFPTGLGIEKIIGSAHASIPMKLVLYENEVRKKEWLFDAYIGTNTFVQRFWDGSTSTGNKRNTENPVYKKGVSYRVRVELDKISWTSAYKNYLAKAILNNTKVYNPVFLHGSSDTPSFTIQNTPAPKLDIHTIEHGTNGELLVRGKAPGFTGEQIRRFQLNFGGDIEIGTEGYQSLPTGNSGFLIRVPDYKYTESYFSKYNYNFETKQFTIPQVTAYVETRDFSIGIVGTPYKIAARIVEQKRYRGGGYVPLKDGTKPVVKDFIVHAVHRHSLILSSRDRSGWRKAINSTATKEHLELLFGRFIESVQKQRENKVHLEQFYIYTTDFLGDTAIDFAVEMYVPPDPREHPYAFAFDVAMTASGAKIVKKGAQLSLRGVSAATEAAVKLFDDSPALARALLERIPIEKLPKDIPPCLVSFSTSSFATLAQDPCSPKNIAKIKEIAVEYVRKGSKLTVQYSSKIDDIFLPHSPALASTIKSKLGQYSVFLAKKPHLRPAKDFIQKRAFLFYESQYKVLRRNLNSGKVKYSSLGRTNRLFTPDDLEKVGKFLFESAEASMVAVKKNGMKIKESGSPIFDESAALSVDFTQVPPFLEDYMIKRISSFKVKLKNSDFIDQTKIIKGKPEKFRGLKLQGDTKDYVLSDLLAVHQLIEQKVIQNKFALNTIEHERFYLTAAGALADLRATSKNGVSKLGMTWHHTDDMKTLQLIPAGIHKVNTHVGGDSFSKRILAAGGNITRDVWSRFTGLSPDSLPDTYFPR